MIVPRREFPVRKGSGPNPGVLAAAAVILCLLVPAASAASAGAGATRLRYRFVPGSAYTLAVGLDLAMDTQVEGLPPEAAALAEMGKDMKQQSSLRLRVEAGGPAPDGAQPLTVYVDDAQASLSAAGRVLQAQGLEPRLEGSIVLAGKLRADARAIELAPRSEADVPDASRELVGMLLQLLPVLPEASLAPGESFEVPVRFTAPGMSADSKLETKGTCRYTLRAVEAGRARFDVEADGVADSTADPARKMRIQIGSRGTAEFDVQEGIFTAIRSELTIGLTIDTEMPGAGAVEPPAAPKRIAIRATAKGPLELTMARTAAAAK